MSRASVTCLLDVELGVEEFFFGVEGVGDVLAELDVELGVVFSLVSRASVTCLLDVELGVDVVFGVKGVDDVLAGRGAGCGRGLWCQGRR